MRLTNLSYGDKVVSLCSKLKPHPVGVYVLETGGCRIQGEVPGKAYFQGSATFTNALVRGPHPVQGLGLRVSGVVLRLYS